VELEEVEWSQAGKLKESLKPRLSLKGSTVRRQDFEVTHDASHRHGPSF
jgi:hypothetical protein